MDLLLTIVALILGFLLGWFIVGPIFDKLFL